MNKIANETRNTNYDSAKRYANNARKLAEKIGYIKGISIAMREFGIILLNQGLYNQALDTTLKALEFTRRIGDKANEAYCLNIIGVMLKSTEKLREAITYFEQSLVIFRSLEINRGIAVVLGNIGDIWYLQHNYDKALEYEREALDYAYLLRDNYVISITLFHLGTIFSDKKRYDSALFYQRKALERFQADKMTKYIAKSLNNLAEVTFALQQYRQSIEYGEQGLAVARSIASYEEAARISHTLADAWKALGNYKVSLQYFQTYVEWKDSLTTLNLQQKLEQFRSKQEVAEKQKRIQILEKEQENQQLLRNSLVGGVIFTLALLALAIQRYLAKQRSQALLQQKQAQLEYQSAEIQLKNTELHENLETLRRTQTQLAQAEKMASLGTLVAGVAHELNTPIGVAVTAASTLHVRTHDFSKRYTEGGLKKSELETYIQTAKTGADLTLRNLERAANLIQSFKQVSVDQTYDNIRRFGVKQYLHEIITSLQPKWKASGHQVKIKCDETLEMETYAGAIAQIITNFVTNSLLHGFEGYREDGVMTITAKRTAPKPNVPKPNVPTTNDHVTIIYSDNGRGIPPEVLPRIFDPFFTMASGLGGTGLGMHIVFNLVTQKLSGSIHAESHFGNGVHFHIHLPNTIFSSPQPQVQ
jgi:signal transduction histidine kinase